MGVTQGGLAPEYGPYGGMGYEVGALAFSLVKALDAQGEQMPFAPDDTPCWGASDRSAFENLHEFDTGIALIDPTEQVDAAELGDLFRNFREFSSALPFSEGERHWLFAAYRAFSPLGIELVDGIVNAETQIVSAGLSRELHGRDLVRRWPAWRRQADEFSKGGTLPNATTTLRFIGEQLVPRSSWPAEYVGLR